MKCIEWNEDFSACTLVRGFFRKSYLNIHRIEQNDTVKWLLSEAPEYKLEEHHVKSLEFERYEQIYESCWRTRSIPQAKVVSLLP